MGNIFLFTLIIGIASALILIPIFKNDQASNKEGKKLKIGVFISVFVILILAVFSFYYISNFDRNLSSLWPLGIVLTALGAVLAKGTDYVYIAPVEFSGFFKWWKGDSTPGYFLLSATDSTANPKFIKSEMVYTPSSYFNKHVERHIRMQNLKKIFYGDVQLEIDENGKPFYIRSYRRSRLTLQQNRVSGTITLWRLCTCHCLAIRL